MPKFETYATEALQEEAAAEKEFYNFEVNVYGEVVVKEYSNHVRINKRDWDKFKQRLIPVLKQGDMKHATGNTEAS